MIFSAIKIQREDVKEEIAEDDLDKIVDLTLTETETIWLLDMPGVCCSTESEEADAILNNNERYQEVAYSKEHLENQIFFFILSIVKPV